MLLLLCTENSVIIILKTSVCVGYLSGSVFLTESATARWSETLPLCLKRHIGMYIYIYAICTVNIYTQYIYRSVLREFVSELGNQRSRGTSPSIFFFSWVIERSLQFPFYICTHIKIYILYIYKE